MIVFETDVCDKCVTMLPVAMCCCHVNAYFVAYTQMDGVSGWVVVLRMEWILHESAVAQG